jgi:glycerol-3-phosphate dehydrogenase (NAD(P)+)
MISEELRAGRYGFAQLGCEDDASYRTVKDLFANTRLFIKRSSDITGISWSVILKNVYAMIFGMADELQMGDNVRGYLAVASIRELEQIVCGKGGDASSPWHLAGLGDLVTTATSKDSHHHELGRMLARGEVEGIQGEGVHTLEMVRRHGLFREEDYPLFELIHSIVSSPGDVQNRLDTYIKQYA